VPRRDFRTRRTRRLRRFLPLRGRASRSFEHDVIARVRKLLDKYADLPMDFADATLVALAEELDCTSVFTTDPLDFSVYRIKGRKPFRILPGD
jgi:predicted nucleic acid-binding protein